MSVIMTELPTVPKNADQITGLIKKFAPLLVDLSIGLRIGILSFYLLIQLRSGIIIVDTKTGNKPQFDPSILSDLIEKTDMDLCSYILLQDEHFSR